MVPILEQGGLDVEGVRTMQLADSRLNNIVQTLNLTQGRMFFGTYLSTDCYAALKGTSCSSRLCEPILKPQSCFVTLKGGRTRRHLAN